MMPMGIGVADEAVEAVVAITGGAQGADHGVQLVFDVVGEVDAKAGDGGMTGSGGACRIAERSYLGGDGVVEGAGVAIAIGGAFLFFYIADSTNKFGILALITSIIIAQPSLRTKAGKTPMRPHFAPLG
ncbi:hypothetical protein A9Q88_07370 [Gammaproteobacteria bacterium 50_400_T64]|nr:hypothetical protein A9Q88_07370 [Gammaproteobacteria bacterium 50_400_T64]